MEHQKEVIANIAMATPSVTNLVLLRVFGISLNEWLAIASIIFILVQMAYLLWKWVREARKP